VEDIVYEDADWAVRYLIVDTRDWLPGKKVPVSADRVLGVSWSGAQIEVDLTAGRYLPKFRGARQLCCASLGTRSRHEETKSCTTTDARCAGYG